MVLIYNSLCGFILGLLLFSWYLAILPGSHGLDYCSFVSLESDCISLLTLFFLELFWKGVNLWNFQVILSVSIEKVPCVFYWMLFMNLGEIDIIIIKSLSTQKKRNISTFISVFFDFSNVCSCQCTYLTHLYGFIHVYMILCEAIENFVFTSIYGCSLLIYKNIVSFCMLLCTAILAQLLVLMCFLVMV